jgi:two-component sensor histidine kinase/CHASE3 domain sensor protein
MAADAALPLQDLQQRSLRKQRTLLITSVMSLLLLVGSTLLVLRISKQSEQADAWVLHTLEVKQQLVQLYALLTSAEAGQRGYLITNDADFLDSYESALSVAPAMLARLHGSLTDNREQQQRLAALEPLVKERLETIEETLQLAARGQRAAAAEIVRTRGRVLMTRIRIIVDDLDEAESRLLDERRGLASDAQTEFTVAITSMLVACAILTLFGLLLVRRYLANLAESRARLTAYNTELEARVRERTEELARTTEIATRERARAEALLTDVNHRVGNNLALVSSFLTMQERAVRNPEAARALEAARERVQAIASAHRKLRLGADFATVKVNEVLGAVLEDISAGLPPDDRIRIHYDVAPLEILARDAVSLGVLTSELVMNAVKHAFAPGTRGEVWVKFSEAGGTAPVLEVADDGVGCDEKQTQATGLGARIIDMVAKQFGGAPERAARAPGSGRPGTRVRIELARLHVVRAT